MRGSKHSSVHFLSRYAGSRMQQLLHLKRSMNITAMVALSCVLQCLTITVLDFSLTAHRSLFVRTIGARSCANANRHLFSLLPDLLPLPATEKMPRVTVVFLDATSVSFCTTRVLFPKKRAGQTTLAQDPPHMEKYSSVLLHYQGNFPQILTQICSVFRGIIYSIIISLFSCIKKLRVTEFKLQKITQE